ncbi:hypothetical protein PVAND_003389 [Polypedilum vanderplanki]|uniref:DUF3752 domain-containing protein n=1 Tax=Polypedilum vanderplanki TaxID=319348 RepID=A0A9J6BTW4_POLVA|nr:hypothetical protein PVAND_003389 [Polypedilum vanderplanki]
MYDSDDSSDSDSGTSFKRGKKTKLDNSVRSPKKESNKRHSNSNSEKYAFDRKDKSDRSEKRVHKTKSSTATTSYEREEDRKRHRDGHRDEKKRNTEYEDKKRTYQRSKSNDRKSRRSRERSPHKSSSHKESSLRQKSPRDHKYDRNEDVRKRRSNTLERQKDGDNRTKRSHSNEKHDIRKNLHHNDKTSSLSSNNKEDKNSRKREENSPSREYHRKEKEEHYQRKERKHEDKRSKSPNKNHSRDHLRHSSVERNKVKENSFDAYGPALPPPNKKQKTPEIRQTKSEIPTVTKEFASKKIPIGPVLPDDYKPRNEENYDRISSDNSDEEDVIGPVIIDKSKMTERELELEKRKIQLKIEALDRRQEQIQTDQREEWMLELPSVKKVHDLGLAARQFRRGEQPDFSDRSSWTKTPNDEQKTQDKTKDHHRNIEKRRHDEATAKRDAEQEEIARKHKKIHKRDKSLLELHEKKMKKEKKKSKDEKVERKPFNRETDLQVNRFDESRKKAAIKSSHLLDDRFSSGQRKYL